MQIYLQNLQFFSHHGLHEEEKILGNWFVVNVIVEVELSSTQQIRLEDTVDYSQIFKVVEKHMQQPTELLENLVKDISAQILAQFSLVEKVSVNICKQQPPIPNYIGNVCVSYSAKK